MIDPYSTPTIDVVHNITTTLCGVAQNNTSTLHGVVHSTNYTFHSMVWPISSWKHGLGWFVIGNSSKIHKTNCQLRFHCYVSIINSKFTDSLIKILSWLFFYEPSSNINFCHLQILTSELFVVIVKNIRSIFSLMNSNELPVSFHLPPRWSIFHQG